MPYPDFGAPGIQSSRMTEFPTTRPREAYQHFGTNLTTPFTTHGEGTGRGSAIPDPAMTFVAENARCRPVLCYSAFDIPHRFVASVLVHAAIGMGQRFLNYAA